VLRSHLSWNAFAFRAPLHPILANVCDGHSTTKFIYKHNKLWSFLPRGCVPRALDVVAVTNPIHDGQLTQRIDFDQLGCISRMTSLWYWKLFIRGLYRIRWMPCQVKNASRQTRGATSGVGNKVWYRHRYGTIPMRIYQPTGQKRADGL
jgi:hypothetical protein